MSNPESGMSTLAYGTHTARGRFVPIDKVMLKERMGQADREGMSAEEKRALARTSFGPEGGVPLIELERDQCKWPLWKHDDDPRHCCGAKATRGSYCEAHARLATAGRADGIRLLKGE
ncbi:GcrA family cell cycle regulator [Roseibium sediminis]|uniref:GcrA family cell cycle regulator n=1 Tax=Roseibium sediminis TaxID=1775174 RepID=UPI00123CD0B8|nr:GcrA family cell cycle regulator [Roseibium sediminis]